MQRKNFSDAVYRSEREKFNAVVDDIAAAHKNGQPVLVGTISIEKSERLSRMLQQRGVPHQVLNAKYHEREAHIIAQAGRYGAVTIATNMAGRGTDIVLGGNAEYLAKMLVEEKAKEEQDEEKKAAMIKKFVDQFRQQCKEEQAKVREQGGLYVIGTERHESRRIDNQLRGRQGRQGDPGSSRFYISLEDDLMRLFGSERIIGIMNALGMEEGQVLEHPLLTGQIEGAQKRVEQHNFEIRKHLLEYDDVMNRQREVIYDMRRSILDRNDASDVIYESIDDIAGEMVAGYLFSGAESGWDISGLEATMQNRFGLELPSDTDAWHQRSQEALTEVVTGILKEAYKKKEETIEPGHMRHLERMILLHTIDAKWKDHLYAMDQLKEGIGLRSYAQRDPLIEFKREAFEMFQMMYASIKDEVVEIMFKIKPTGQETRMRSVFGSLPMQTIHNDTTGMASRQAASQQAAEHGQGNSEPDDHANTIKNDGPKVGRNDPCPCGSGLKYKKCHGK
jgi:preprotein translocase subunit SecA